MIVGLGLDLCEIDRIEQMIQRWGARFSDRVFTEHERDYAMAKTRHAQHLAGRFAVKEATLKALGAPAGLSWKEMEDVGGCNVTPRLRLSGRAGEAAAAAAVVAERA